MILSFDEKGLVVLGVHWHLGASSSINSGQVAGKADWPPLYKISIEYLKTVCCQIVYVNGSFGATKEVPSDFGACWEGAEVDPAFSTLFS